MARVEDMLAWKAFWAVWRALKLIRRARGYNTSPYVTDDMADALSSDARAVLFLDVVSHGRIDRELSGGWTQALVIGISGTVRLQPGESPRREALALEQDVRNAVRAAQSTIQAAMGRGNAFDWTVCEHDRGMLAEARQAGFYLEAELVYKQGSTF